MRIPFPLCDSLKMINVDVIILSGMVFCKKFTSELNDNIKQLAINFAGSVFYQP